MAALNIPFPSVLAPSSMVEKLKSNTRMHISQVSGIPTTVENPGARWEFELGYSGMDGDELKTTMITEALAKVRGHAKRIQIHNMARPQTTGTLDVTSLVSNSDFFLGNTGWSNIPGTGGRVTFSGGKARLARGTSAASITQTSIAMSATTTYSIHIALHSPSAETDAIRVAVGGSTNDFTGEGRHTATFTSTGTTNLVITNLTNNSVISVSDIRVSRAATSDGVDQTGSRIDVQGLGGLAEDVVNPLDFVSINGELKKVVDVLVSDAGGLGTLVIEPPMHSPVPDNSDVIFDRPFSKFLLAEDSHSIAITPPYITGFGLNLIEDIT